MKKQMTMNMPLAYMFLAIMLFVSSASQAVINFSEEDRVIIEEASNTYGELSDLMKAAVTGRVQDVRRLLAENADPEQVNGWGVSAISLIEEELAEMRNSPRFHPENPVFNTLRQVAKLLKDVRHRRAITHEERFPKRARIFCDYDSDDSTF